MAREGRIEEVGRAIAQGRAFLLLGQRHSVDSVESATADIAAVLGTPAMDSLPLQYSSMGTVPTSADDRHTKCQEGACLQAEEEMRPEGAVLLRRA